MCNISKYNSICHQNTHVLKNVRIHLVCLQNGRQGTKSHRKGHVEERRWCPKRAVRQDAWARLPASVKRIDF